MTNKELIEAEAYKIFQWTETNLTYESKINKIDESLHRIHKATIDRLKAKMPTEHTEQAKTLDGELVDVKIVSPYNSLRQEMLDILNAELK